MRHAVGISAAILLVWGPSATSAQDRSAQWTLYEETTVPGSVSGSITTGRTFRTASGSIYEVTLGLGLILELSPRLTVLRSGPLFRLILQGFDGDLYARQLVPPSSESPSTPETPDVVESRVDGEFEGFDGQTIVRLVNGQIWEQIDGRYRYRYRYSPTVLIIRDGSGYRMQVDGIDDWFRVQRLR